MPTYYLAPDPCNSTFLIPGTNTPGNGVQVFTYAQGTTTKVSVAKDVAGAALHTNPIVLDAGGNLPSASSMYIEAGVEIDVVYAPSGDTDPPASAYRTVSNVQGVPPEQPVISQWVTLASPIFVNTHAFRVTGDQTVDLHVGRRIRTTNTGGTIYSRISSSVFATSTTIGLINDSGSLDSGLSTAAYGLLSVDDPSSPLLDEFYPLRQMSTDIHSVGLNLQNYTSSHTVTLPDYELTLTSSQAISTAVDYIASTFTPYLAFGSSSGSTGVTYTQQLGQYVRLGELITAFIYLDITSTGVDTGTARISGLPAKGPSGAIQNAMAFTPTQWSNFTTQIYSLSGDIGGSEDEIILFGVTSTNTGNGTFALSDGYFSNSTLIAGTITYQTA